MILMGLGSDLQKLKILLLVECWEAAPLYHQQINDNQRQFRRRLFRKRPAVTVVDMHQINEHIPE